MTETIFQRVERALEDIRAGKMVILVDDEDRENEGDLVMAADKVTPEAINFMAKYARGLICLTLTGERLNQLGIPMMVSDNTSQFGTAFTVSIEARHGVTTGISAADRSHTIKVAVDADARPSDLVMPGHIFPLRAREGGVLVRTGQTEGSVDLSRLAGSSPAGVICEIMNDDGTMARMDDLEVFAKEHDMVLLSIADLIHYRLRAESLVEKLVDEACPSEFGEGFRIAVYRSRVDGTEHIAFYKGAPEPDSATLVRVQYHIAAADVFRVKSSKYTDQVKSALERIESGECGVLLYMYPPELSAYRSVMRYVFDREDEIAEQDAEKAVNTVKPQFRDFGVGAQILADLGVGKIRLLTNQPKRKIVGLEGYGLEVVDTVALTLEGQ